MHTCFHAGKEYRAMDGFLSEAVSVLLEKHSVFPDWGRGTDAFAPLHLTLNLNGSHLLLQQVRVMAVGDVYPPIAGVNPELPTATERYARYRGLNIPLSGNGTIYLVVDQVWDAGRISGVSQPYDYKTVLEVEIKGSSIIGIHDRSAEAKEDRFKRGPSPMGILFSLMSTDKSYWIDLLALLSQSGDYSPKDQILVSKMANPAWVPNNKQARRLMEICSSSETLGLANPIRIEHV